MKTLSVCVPCAALILVGTPLADAHSQKSDASASGKLQFWVNMGNEFYGTPSGGQGTQFAQSVQSDVLNYGIIDPPCQAPFGILSSNTCPFFINQTVVSTDLNTIPIAFDDFIVSGCDPAYGTGIASQSQFSLMGAGACGAISGGFHPPRDGTSTRTCPPYNAIPERGEPCSWRTYRTGLASDLTMTMSASREPLLVESSGTVQLSTIVGNADASGTRARHWRGNATFLVPASVVGVIAIDIDFFAGSSSTPTLSVSRRGILRVTPYGIGLYGDLDRTEFADAITPQNYDTYSCFQDNIRSVSLAGTRVDDLIAFPAGTTRMTISGRVRFNPAPFPIGPNGEIDEATLNAFDGVDPTTGSPTRSFPSNYLPVPGTSFDLNGDGVFDCNDRTYLAISYAGGSRSIDDPQTSPFADLDLDGTVSVQEAQYLLSQLGSPCNCPANIADDQGTPLPTTEANNGVTEGDYNAFFSGFFDSLPYCDIADDEGHPFPSAGVNNGVTEADYNVFFNSFFNC